MSRCSVDLPRTMFGYVREAKRLCVSAKTWHWECKNEVFGEFKRFPSIEFGDSSSKVKYWDSDWVLIENSVTFQGKTHSLSKRDIREVIKFKRSLLSGEGARNPCLVKNGKYPPYPPCNVKAVSDWYWIYMEQSVKMCQESIKLNNILGVWIYRQILNFERTTYLKVELHHFASCTEMKRR